MGTPSHSRLALAASEGLSLRDSYAAALHVLDAYALEITHNGFVTALHIPDPDVIPPDLEPKIGAYWPHLVPEVYFTTAKSVLREAADGRVRVLEYVARLADGQEHWYRCRVVQSEASLLVVIQDVTGQRRLVDLFLTALGREQNRTAAELHDGIGSQLTAVAMTLSALVREARKGNSVSADAIDEVLEMVHHSTDDVRSLARGLNPAESDSSQLVMRLRDLVARMGKQSQIDIQLHESGEVFPLPPAVPTHVLRIAQEALTNAVRHSSARRIDVRLEFDRPGVALVVEDDGVGITEMNGESDGLGLRLMNYRALTISGSCTVERRAEGGTRVTCLVNKAPPEPGAT